MIVREPTSNLFECTLYLALGIDFNKGGYIHQANIPEQAIQNSLGHEPVFRWEPLNNPHPLEEKAIQLLAERVGVEGVGYCSLMHSKNPSVVVRYDQLPMSTADRRGRNLTDTDGPDLDYPNKSTRFVFTLRASPKDLLRKKTLVEQCEEIDHDTGIEKLFRSYLSFRAEKGQIHYAVFDNPQFAQWEKMGLVAGDPLGNWYVSHDQKYHLDLAYLASNLNKAIGC